MDKTDVNVEADMRFLKVPTATQPAGPVPDDQLSTIGIGVSDVPEAGGRVLLVSVLDGEGKGAIALFTGPALHSLLGQMVGAAVQGGLIQAEPVHIENLSGAPGGLN